MKILIVGLGSMGKRRIRCLKALGISDIYGFDLRKDRTEEVSKLYGVGVFNDFNEAFDKIGPDALIISVPPQYHIIYIKTAIEKGIHFFVEASVVDDGMKAAIDKINKMKIVAAPSATMMFHPAIKLINKIVKDGELGQISNILLHVGQYLPDWHAYEKVSDYYVSNPATGGGREIVPFELTWFTMVFGYPKRVSGNYRKTIEIVGAEKIEDTYNCLLDYGDHLSVVTVDVVSRFATRRLVINGSEKQLYWAWEENCIKIYDPKKGAWENRDYQMISAQQGYNSNIGENMYIEEIADFLSAIKGEKKYINTMEGDYDVLQLLYKVEEADKAGKYINV